MVIIMIEFFFFWLDKWAGLGQELMLGCNLQFEMFIHNWSEIFSLGYFRLTTTLFFNEFFIDKILDKDIDSACLRPTDVS